jgi:hypothetical protein
MFRIGTLQTIKFSQLAYLSFQERMREHLQRTVPEAVATMSDEVLNDVIRQGVSRAARYRIFEQPSIASFIQIEFEEGFDFDVDPSRPWFQLILNDDSLDETSKIDALWASIDAGGEESDVELDDDEDDADDDDTDEDDGNDDG